MGDFGPSGLPPRPVHLYLLGAGFSKAISAEMPVLPELIDYIFKARTSTELSWGFENYWPRFGNDFELWLTYLAEDNPWLSEAENTRNRADFLQASSLLARVILGCQARAISSPFPQWLGKLINVWKSEQAVVASFNYDTLVERAFSYVDAGLKDMPNVPQFRDYHQSMYAVPVLGLESRFRSEYNRRQAYPRLLKLHGSVNWWYSGSPIAAGESLFDSGITPGWSPDAADDPGALFAGALEKVPFIVPPTSGKLSFFRNEAIRAQWRVAATALESATTVYLLGYSIPEGDSLVRTFLAASSSVKTLIPVDIDGTVAERLGRLKRHDLDERFIRPANPIPVFVESLEAG